MTTATLSHRRVLIHEKSTIVSPFQGKLTRELILKLIVGLLINTCTMEADRKREKSWSITLYVKGYNRVTQLELAHFTLLFFMFVLARKNE